MLEVRTNNAFSGLLNRMDSRRYSYTYGQKVAPSVGVSLTMPVRPESWISKFELHPIFQMNLPEGKLKEFLRNSFAKTTPNFDELELLRITGDAQIGRLTYNADNQIKRNLSECSINEIIQYEGAEDLFTELLKMYATASGVSGVQPKVLVLSDTDQKLSSDHKVMVRGTTHIIKTWDNQYPELALNEHLCLSAARNAGLKTPHWQLSNNRKFLVVERFDISENGSYMGIEDFCVLQGKSVKAKYDSSFERAAKTVRQFSLPKKRQGDLKVLFKIFVLSVVLRNGDAHLKNFCILYNDPTLKRGWLSPTFDHVTTTAYLPNDIMALTLDGSKRWPTRKQLLEFGITRCDLAPIEAEQALEEVMDGISMTMTDFHFYKNENEVCCSIISKMQKEWEQGLSDLSRYTIVS